VTLADSRREDNPQGNKAHNDELADIVRWRCLTCGQQHFTTPGQEPPDICDYCQDMTTWERLESANGRYHDNNR